MVDESAPASMAKVCSRLTGTPMVSNVLFQCPELIKAIELTNSKPIRAFEKMHPLLLIHSYLGKKIPTDQHEMSRSIDIPVSIRG